jgi:two-component system, OmpR family, aerobic respiration control sensor histidine kinase ArcB
MVAFFKSASGFLGMSGKNSKEKATAHKKEFSNYNDSYRFLETIVSKSPCYVYWKNEDFIYMGCNELLATALNLPTTDYIVGKTDYDFGWDLEKVIQYRIIDEDIIKTGKAKLNFEEIITNADGSITILLVNKMPILDDNNNVIGIVGISIDITERKEMECDLFKAKEQAEVASQAKTNFLENMRHDIRNPLAGVVGCARLLQEEKDPEKSQKFIQGIIDSSQEVLDFLNAILESFNASSGNIPLVMNKFDLRETLNKVITLHQSMAIQKQLALTLDIDAAIPKFLVGDSVRTYRIILELLVNALKFTHEGYVQVIAKLAKKDNHELILKIIVEDTGIGIPEDKQQDLFLRFTRLTPSCEGIYKGSGLGLSIAKQFLDDLKAEIYIDSCVGKGTKFACIIPFKEALLEEDAFADIDIPVNVTATHTAATGAAFSKEKNDEWIQDLLKPKRHVLLIEDNPIATLIAKSILQDNNCDVETAKDGTTAVMKATSDKYDLIFVDIGLADIDGYEVTRRIRAFEQTSNEGQACIIGLTAHVDAHRSQTALDAGMNFVLEKPLTQLSCHNILQILPRRAARAPVPMRCI